MLTLDDIKDARRRLGRTERVVKRAPKADDYLRYVKESVPLGEVEGYLRLMQNAGRLRYQRNNTGAIRDKTNRPVTFGEAGSPDFYVFLPGGKLLQLEVKRPVGGKLSPNQEAWRDAMMNLGHRYEVVTSGIEAQKFVESALKGFNDGR